MHMGTKAGTASDSTEEVQLPCYEMLWNKKKELIMLAVLITLETNTKMKGEDILACA